ncbi:MAG: hypothetical protein WDW38_002117 [Sanguina aurantia]
MATKLDVSSLSGGQVVRALHSMLVLQLPVPGCYSRLLLRLQRLHSNSPSQNQTLTAAETVELLYPALVELIDVLGLQESHRRDAAHTASTPQAGRVESSTPPATGSGRALPDSSREAAAGAAVGGASERKTTRKPRRAAGGISGEEEAVAAQQAAAVAAATAAVEEEVSVLHGVCAAFLASPLGRSIMPTRHHLSHHANGSPQTPDTTHPSDSSSSRASSHNTRAGDGGWDDSSSSSTSSSNSGSSSSTAGATPGPSFPLQGLDPGSTGSPTGGTGQGLTPVLRPTFQAEVRECMALIGVQTQNDFSSADGLCVAPVAINVGGVDVAIVWEDVGDHSRTRPMRPMGQALLARGRVARRFQRVMTVQGGRWREMRSPQERFDYLIAQLDE